MNSDEQARGVCVEPNCPTCSPAIVSRSTWHLDEVDRVLYGPSETGTPDEGGAR